MANPNFIVHVAGHFLVYWKSSTGQTNVMIAARYNLGTPDCSLCHDGSGKIRPEKFYSMWHVLSSRSRWLSRRSLASRRCSPSVVEELVIIMSTAMRCGCDGGGSDGSAGSVHRLSEAKNCYCEMDHIGRKCERQCQCECLDCETGVNLMEAVAAVRARIKLPWFFFLAGKSLFPCGFHDVHAKLRMIKL